jgi:hypothetical protein
MGKTPTRTPDFYLPLPDIGGEAAFWITRNISQKTHHKKQRIFL